MINTYKIPNRSNSPIESKPPRSTSFRINFIYNSIIKGESNEKYLDKLMKFLTRNLLITINEYVLNKKLESILK